MYQVIIVIHILLGLSIVGLILMQQGRGADAGAGFGGGASGSVFGAQGAASFLSRMTAILATLFFITSLGLAWMNGNKGGSVVDFMSAPEAEQTTSDLIVPNTDGSVNNVPQTEVKTVTDIPPAPSGGEQPPTTAAPVVGAAPLVAEPGAGVGEPASEPKAEEAKAPEEKKEQVKAEEHTEKKPVKAKKKHANK